jgi:hypothetical protein
LLAFLVPSSTATTAATFPVVVLFRQVLGVVPKVVTIVFLLLARVLIFGLVCVRG